jgi:hypothetical protein
MCSATVSRLRQEQAAEVPRAAEVPIAMRVVATLMHVGVLDRVRRQQTYRALSVGRPHIPDGSAELVPARSFAPAAILRLLFRSLPQTTEGERRQLAAVHKGRIGNGGGILDATRQTRESLLGDENNEHA